MANPEDRLLTPDIAIRLFMMPRSHVKLVMGIVQNQNKNNPAQTTSTGQDYSLNKSELEFLLLLVKRSTFVGEQIEEVYNTVYKLQQQYLDIK